MKVVYAVFSSNTFFTTRQFSVIRSQGFMKDRRYYRHVISHCEKGLSYVQVWNVHSCEKHFLASKTKWG